jgi:hypothetical protein
MQAPVDTHYKAVCGFSISEIMGSNPTRAEMSVFFECSVLSGEESMTIIQVVFYTLMLLKMGITIVRNMSS